MSYADLGEQNLEDGLRLLLQQMEKMKILPKGTDKEGLLKTLMESVKNAFGKEPVPQEIFTDPSMVKSLMMIACAVQIKGMVPETSLDPDMLTLILLNPDSPEAKLLMEISPSSKAYKELLRLKHLLSVKRGQALSATKMNVLLNKLVKIIAQKGKRGGPLSAHSLNGEFTKEDLSNLQMLGVTRSGLAVPIAFVAGNAAGATDIAVLQSTEGRAGFMFLIDNLAANISPQSRANLDRNLEAIGGSYESAQDANKAFQEVYHEFQETLREHHVLREPPRPVAGRL